MNFNNIKTQYITYIKEAMNFIETLPSTKLTALDIETTGLNFIKDRMLGISIAQNENEGCYISVRNWNEKEITNLLTLINIYLEKTCMWNFFFDKSFTLKKYGVGLNCTIDGKILYHLLNQEILSSYKMLNSYNSAIGHRSLFNYSPISLKSACIDLLDYPYYEKELDDFKKQYCKDNKIKKKEFSYGSIPDNILAPYACYDAVGTYSITEKLLKVSAKNKEAGWTQLPQLYRWKHDMCEAYIKAKCRGIKVNRKAIPHLYKKLRKKQNGLWIKIDKHKAIRTMLKIIKQSKVKKKKEALKNPIKISQIRRIIKDTVANMNSSIQKQVLFYIVLKQKIEKTTDKGSPKTDKYVLETIANKGIKIAEQVRDYTLYNTVVNDFIGRKGQDKSNALWSITTDEYPYIHSNFAITGTITGRIANSQPNLQQFPSRGIGKDIKRLIIPREDYRLVEIDYKTSELRILAGLSKEHNFMEAFNNNLDLHALTAYKMFKDKMTLVNSKDNLKGLLTEIKEKYGDTYRYYSKSINFGLAYGITEHGLSNDLGCSVQEAKKYIAEYYKINHKIKEYMHKKRVMARDCGYAEDIFGQRINLPSCKFYNTGIKSNLDDIFVQLNRAVNFPIQGSNAILLYRDTLKLLNKVKDLDWNMLFTRYDSVMFEIHKDVDTQFIKDILRECYEVKLNGIDMKIDISIGELKQSWYSLKEV